jgi:hypothetical protein
MIVPAIRPFENILIAELVECYRQPDPDIIRQRHIWQALDNTAPPDITAELSAATIEKALELIRQ